jgi:transposase
VDTEDFLRDIDACSKAALSPAPKASYSQMRIEALELRSEGLTQGQIAERVGAHPTTVHRWLDGMPRPISDQQRHEHDLRRFFEKVDKTDECWEWLGTRCSHGYCRLYFNGRMQGAHRAGYELIVGQIPDGLELDHLCRNPPCVNPAHLEPVTHWENMRRSETPAAVNLVKTHCIRGHEFTPENTRVRAGRVAGQRTCRICERDRLRASSTGRAKTARKLERQAIITEKIAEARRMRADGVLLREIAEHFEVGLTTAHRWTTDDEDVAA